MRRSKMFDYEGLWRWLMSKKEAEKKEKENG